MKEIKSPKKPLIFYYGIVLLLIVLFNFIISPILMERQVMQVDYGTFMKMIAVSYTHLTLPTNSRV